MIPAGTGMRKYRSVKLDSDYKKMIEDIEQEYVQADFAEEPEDTQDVSLLDDIDEFDLDEIEEDMTEKNGEAETAVTLGEEFPNLE